MFKIRFNPTESFSFEVLGYQFPDSEDKGYDGNWLMIGTEIDCRLGKWKSVDPSLLTSEITSLIEDLVKAKAGNNRSSIYFTEPNLEFEVGPPDADSIYLKVSFALESRPKDWEEGRECWIDGRIPMEEFHAIIEAFRNEAKKYPERV